MAGTDSTRELVQRPGPAIILVEAQLGENIGAAARAMANFGLWDLRLVNPRDGWPNEKAVASAAKAHHVIDGVRVFDRLEDAVSDLSFVLATTARKRELTKQVFGPDDAAKQLKGHIDGGRSAGLLFGRERWGLNNDEIALCDALVTLPVEPAFASLNIAQAVLVLSYEWRRASDVPELLFDSNIKPPASKEQLVGLFEHIEGELDESGFFKTEEKRPTVVQNLRTMLSRATFSEQEVRTMRGVVASLTRRHTRVNPSRSQSKQDKS